MAVKATKYLILPIIFLSLTSCSRESSQEAQGYIEGSYTYIATSVSGIIKKLLVDRGSHVKAGQQLFILDEQPESDNYLAAVEKLKATEAVRDAIAANLVFAKLTYERNKVLVPKKAIQQSELDSAQATYDATLAQLAEAEANIAEARADVAAAKWQKDQKIVYAPEDAIVFQKYYRLGEYYSANQPILSLLAARNIKVIFYIPEKNLSRIHLNDKISVACDSCEKKHTAYISFISPSAEYTPPVIYSNQTNEKLIYRIEAKFLPGEAFALHPGQPVYVTYPLREHSS